MKSCNNDHQQQTRVIVDTINHRVRLHHLLLLDGCWADSSCFEQPKPFSWPPAAVRLAYISGQVPRSLVRLPFCSLSALLQKAAGLLHCCLWLVYLQPTAAGSSRNCTSRTRPMMKIFGMRLTTSLPSQGLYTQYCGLATEKVLKWEKYMKEWIGWLERLKT